MCLGSPCLVAGLGNKNTKSRRSVRSTDQPEAVADALERELLAVETTVVEMGLSVPSPTCRNLPQGFWWR